MLRSSRLAAIASAFILVAFAATGIGVRPVSASKAPARLTCAGPSRAEANFIAHAKALGIHAQEAVYDRSLIGCIPLAANGKPKTNLLQTALREQRALVAPRAGNARRALSPTGGA